MDTPAPTPERLARDEFVTVPTDRAGVTAHQAVTQDALDRYWRRGELSPGRPAENARRYEAGRRLREAWERSGMAQLAAGGLLPSVDGAGDPEARIVGAMDKAAEFRRLIAEVGMTCSGAVVDCCCHGLAVGKGATMERLRIGLARLADALRI